MITKDELETLFSVIDGADIYCRSIAENLIAIQKKHPEYLEITKPMMYQGNGTDQMPYFGAITTQMGLRAIRKEIESREHY